MDDEVSSVATRVDPVLKPTDTQTQITTASPIAEDRHEDKQSAAPTQETQLNVDREQEKAKREDGKLKQVQAELEQERSRNQRFEKYFVKSEKRFKRALVETNGLSEAEADTFISNAKTQNPGLWADQMQKEVATSKETTKTTFDQDYIDKLVTQKLESDPRIKFVSDITKRREDEENQWLSTFETERPDIAEGRSDEEAYALRGELGATAARYMKNKKLDKKEAFDLAYTAILHPEKLAEKGKMEGYLQAVNKNSGVGTTLTTSGLTSRNTNYPEPSAAQQSVMDATGMSAEDYFESLNEETTRVKPRVKK